MAWPQPMAGQAQSAWHTRSTFETRTEAALYFDLVGGDGQNFPGDLYDAEQMAETLRDVRSMSAARNLYAVRCYSQHQATSQPASSVC